MRNIKQVLAVSVSLLSVAFNANATMTNTNSGDSSFVLTLLSGGSSASFDLGFNYSSYSSLNDNFLNPLALSNAKPDGVNYIWDLAGDSNYANSWSSFTNGKNLSDINWAIFAGDNTGTAAGAKGLVSTFSGFSGVRETSSQLATLLTNANVYIDTNNTLGSHMTSSNGSSVSLDQPSNGSLIYNETAKKLLGTDIVAMSGLDETMRLVSVTSSIPSFLTPSVTYRELPIFTLGSNGVLTFWNGRMSPVTALPEADTWAMLLIGLGAIAGLSRMKNNQPTAAN